MHFVSVSKDSVSIHHCLYILLSSLNTINLLHNLSYIKLVLYYYNCVSYCCHSEPLHVHDCIFSYKSVFFLWNLIFASFSHLLIYLFFSLSFQMLQQISQVLNVIHIIACNFKLSFCSFDLLLIYLLQLLHFFCSSMDQLITRLGAWLFVLEFSITTLLCRIFCFLDSIYSCFLVYCFIFQKHILLYLSMSLCSGGKVFESLNVWTFLYFLFYFWLYCFHCCIGFLFAARGGYSLVVMHRP